MLSPELTPDFLEGFLPEQINLPPLLEEIADTLIMHDSENVQEIAHYILIGYANGGEQFAAEFIAELSDLIAEYEDAQLSSDTELDGQLAIW